MCYMRWTSHLALAAVQLDLDTPSLWTGLLASLLCLSYEAAD